MTTTNITATPAWQRIALAADDVALITSDAVAPIQYATSTDADAPTGLGHTCTAGDRLTRAQLGAGAIWARIAPDWPFDEATIVLSTGTHAPQVAVGSVEISGPVTVSNEVEVKNDTGSPIPATALTPAANGTPLPLASLAQSIAYNGDGTVSHVEVTHAGTVYRQTLTYTDGRLTAVSAWEAQP